MTDPIGTAHIIRTVVGCTKELAEMAAKEIDQSRIAEVGRLTERLRELEAAAQPFADTIVIDPDKKRGDRHWATCGSLTNLDHVLALQAALSLQRRV